MYFSAMFRSFSTVFNFNCCLLEINIIDLHIKGLRDERCLFISDSNVWITFFEKTKNENITKTP